MHAAMGTAYRVGSSLQAIPGPGGNILRIAVSNAVVAGIAAPAVWGFGRLVRRPALMHALWLVVLLKLLTPPLWTIPVRALPATRTSAPTLEVVPPVREIPLAVSREPHDAPILQADVAAPAGVEEAYASPAPVWPTMPPVARSPAVVPAVTLPAGPVFPDGGMAWRWLCPIVVGVWAIGSLLCLGVTALRIAKFRKVLRFAVPAPAALQQQARALAGRLGVRDCPGVWLVPGAMCPMLWSAGARARVLVPWGLWGVLDDAQRDTLLLHELAHLRRRDHWVRWLELAATVLYWWHPACWWARRGLREAEEQCCDAWVLWARPGAFRAYATALLTTVDFVSVRQPVPALASGMGQFHLLKARLTMLKKGDVSRALTWGGLWAACGVGAVLLSIAPTLAQSAPEVPAGNSQTAPVAPEAAPPPPTAPEQNGPTAEPAQITPPVASQTTAPIPLPAPSASQVGQAEIAPGSALPPTTPPTAEVGNAPPTPEAAPGIARVRDMQFRADMQAVQARNMAQAMAQNDEVAKLRQQVETLSLRLEEANRQLQQAQAWTSANANPRNPYAIEARPQSKVGIRWSTTPAVVSRNGLPAVGNQNATTTSDDRERRLDNLERTLSSLLDEVRSMRQNSPSPTTTPPAGLPVPGPRP
jgi:beta-lactamase regulating signal transducer with metallopeptidase domain